MVISNPGNITLIDDTYNANPNGVAYALATLKRYSGRKICVLGDMLELGKYSIQQHMALSPKMIDAEISVAFLYGKEMTAVTSSIVPIQHFEDKRAMTLALLQELKPGDVVLVKGSRSLHLEETVSAIQESLS